MKNLINFTLLLIALMTGSSVLNAQEKWFTPLENVLKSDQSLDQKRAILNRIALANPDACMPNYYAARVEILTFYTSNGSCKTCLDKADQFIEKAEDADNNAEVMTMRASYYQAKLNEAPYKAPYYGPKASSLLEKAMKLDANNPRAAGLYAQNVYYSPAMFGGGKDAAKPLLENALKLYEAEVEKERIAIAPTWGKNRIVKLLESY